MKKFLSLFLAVTLLTGLLSFPAAAAGGIKDHEHTLDDGTVTREPTCYVAGWMTYTCTDPDCDYIYRVPIPATGHNLDEGVITVPPTCTGFGDITYTCQNPGCTYTTTHLVSYTGHRMELDEVISEPTCNHAGLTRYVCTHEGCHATQIINFPSLGHRLDNGTVTVEPTCASSGTIVYACTREGCTYTRSQWLPPLEHTWDEGTVAIEPTEYAWGRRIYTCTGCGQTYPAAIPPFSAIFRLGMHAGAHYAIDPDTDTTIRADGEMNFTITFDDGWKAGDDFTVSAPNALIREEADGTFTIYRVEADTRITVSGIVEDR